MRRHEDDVETRIETEAFLSGTPVAYCLTKQFREIGHGIECFYICKSIRKLASCGIAQLRCSHVAFLADFPKFSSMEGELQSIDLGRHHARRTNRSQSSESSPTFPIRATSTGLGAPCTFISHY